MHLADLQCIQAVHLFFYQYVYYKKMMAYNIKNTMNLLKYQIQMFLFLDQIKH